METTFSLWAQNAGFDVKSGGTFIKHSPSCIDINIIV
jgi:hypothetical protein